MLYSSLHVAANFTGPLVIVIDPRDGCRPRANPFAIFEIQKAILLRTIWLCLKGDHFGRTHSTEHPNEERCPNHE
jgi:hypothetical protein